eukprot:CAMPEP_0177746950 /NCGR_PEP_ID=MMETSP0484_2-20121128/31140_1 /TAXON_ID=354590 /ORGANISM="Rhodomonas lens, Strain RHODO" /LENGTH=139 /DNA_ID=CAMNT_0019261729 /DNA_START=51 /DNA_END=472 /DNA_ORIENTATION=+
MVVFLILVRVQVHVMVSACVPLALACGRAFERVLAVVQQLGGDGVGVESQDLIRLRVNTSASLSSSSSDPASSSRIAPARGQEEGWSRRQGGKRRRRFSSSSDADSSPRGGRQPEPESRNAPQASTSWPRSMRTADTLK